MALEPMWAGAAAVAVVIGVILVWKLVKLAVRIAIVGAAAVLLFFLARQAGWL